MPASTSSPGTVRSAAVINEEIRELAGRIVLTRAQVRRMTALWAEYGDAMAREAGQEEAA